MSTRDRLRKLARRLGIPTTEQVAGADLVRLGFVPWNGKVMSMHVRHSDADITHDIGHWLCATDARRAYAAFRLWWRDEHYQEEQMASAVGILLHRGHVSRRCDVERHAEAHGWPGGVVECRDYFHDRLRNRDVLALRVCARLRAAGVSCPNARIVRSASSSAAASADKQGKR